MSLTQINKAGLDEIALDHVFTIGASGSSAYTFQGEGLNGTVNNPTLYLTRGKTYRFENGTGGHPIRIQSTAGASGTAYNTGVTNNAGGGTVIVEVQHDAPDVLYYQCTSHAAMNGILYITGALADGGVTTAKIADDAVTGAKIASNAIDSEHYATGSIDSAFIADQAVTLDKLPHGTGSNDGKFLRANNGADPSFESIPAGTINNNADNRVITGSGTANTLNGEANLFFDGSQLGVGTTSPYQYSIAHFESTNGITLAGSSQSRLLFRHTGGGTDLKMMDIQSSNGIMKFRKLADSTTATDRMVIDSSGNVGIGITSPSQKLHLKDTAPMAQIESSSYSSFVGTAESDNNIGNGTKAGNLVLRGQTGVSILGNNGTATQVKIDADGLKFNTDTAAANALDDYEEGTWTPSFSGNISFSSKTNFTYTKIGRIVHITGYLYGQSGTFSPTWQITNLPFVGDGNYNMAPLWSHGADLAFMAYISNNSTNLNIRDRDGATAQPNELSVQMTYITAT